MVLKHNILKNEEALKIIKVIIKIVKKENTNTFILYTNGLNFYFLFSFINKVIYKMKQKIEGLKILFIGYCLGGIIVNKIIKSLSSNEFNVYGIIGSFPFRWKFNFNIQNLLILNNDGEKVLKIKKGKNVFIKFWSRKGGIFNHFYAYEKNVKKVEEFFKKIIKE